MPRYFIEVAYMGTNYAGSQKQDNANSVQSELEKALGIFFRLPFELTGSSRTDAGVHARQNFFHFDSQEPLLNGEKDGIAYHLNAILPPDVVVKSLREVTSSAHCRFDALSRTYEYTLYWEKNPFLKDRAYYYPFPINITRLNILSQTLLGHHDFQTFAKKNIQVHTFNCAIQLSEWTKQEECIIYRVASNRFLRGMVKGLVGTMLRSSQQAISVDEFVSIMNTKNPAKANFAVPSHGLILKEVQYEVSALSPKVTNNDSPSVH